jgi:Zn finger protein HypA/HybF involved in hydrogenase expression
MSEEAEVRSPDQKYPYMTLWRGVNWMPPDCWCAECDYIGPHPDFSEETRREFEDSLLSMDMDPECPKCGSDEMYVEPYDASPVYDPTEGGLHSGIRRSLEYSLRIPWLEYEYKWGQTIHCELTVRLIEEGTYDMSLGWLCDGCEYPFSSPDWPETCPECNETERLVAFHPSPTDSQNPYECMGCGAFWFGDRWERPTSCPSCRTQYWNMMPPRGERDSPRYYTMPSSPLTVLEFTYWSRFGELS